MVIVHFTYRTHIFRPKHLLSDFRSWIINLDIPDDNGNDWSISEIKVKV